MKIILTIVLLPVQLFLLAVSLWIMCVSFFGLTPVRKRQAAVPPRTRFACLIPAHNEEAVVAKLIESLHANAYPRELVDIYVIADNCTDNTAAAAAAAGAQVLIRQHSDLRGKGFALQWALDQLWERGLAVDAFVILDADNLVSSDFLAQLNERYQAGAKVIQSYLDTKNPDDTWITRQYYLSYLFMNRSWQLARSRLGLANALGGTGMCIDSRLLQAIGWNAYSLTEDLEFTVQAFLAGHAPVWAHHAVVYDEKPLTFGQSWRQRERWMRGHAAVMIQYVPLLLRYAMARRSWAALDLMMYLLAPVRLTLQVIAFGFSLLNWVVPLSTYMYLPWARFGTILWIAPLINLFVYPSIFMLLEGVPARRLVSMWLWPLWTFTWIPLAVLGVLRRHDTTWNHTRHTRSLDVRDVERGERS